MGVAPQPQETLQPDETSDGGGEPIFAEINITLLTDVFLVMLVIFMVSALAVQAERNVEKRRPPPVGIAVVPPDGQQHDIDPRQATLVLELPNSGGVYIGGKRFTDDDIDRLFRTAARRPQTQVIVRADRSIQLGRAVEVMARARALGLRHIVIGTRAP